MQNNFARWLKILWNSIRARKNRSLEAGHSQHGLMLDHLASVFEALAVKGQVVFEDDTPLCFGQLTGAAGITPLDRADRRQP